MDGGAGKAGVHGVAEGLTWLSNFPFTFHFHALEKEITTHSGVLAWRVPGMGEPGGLPSLGSHRVGHDWSALAAAAAEGGTLTLRKFGPKLLAQWPKQHQEIHSFTQSEYLLSRYRGWDFYRNGKMESFQGSAIGPLNTQPVQGHRRCTEIL